MVYDLAVICLFGFNQIAHFGRKNELLESYRFDIPLICALSRHIVGIILAKCEGCRITRQDFFSFLPTKGGIGLSYFGGYRRVARIALVYLPQLPSANADIRTICSVFAPRIRGRQNKSS